MKDISYHILDIVQNSLNAGAGTVAVEITENSGTGRLCLKIEDDGAGMSSEALERATDPFFTSSVTKKVGLGLPLLRQNAELTGGSFRMNSVVNKGTVVIADFNSSHIDMIPFGDIAMTFRLLIAANPEKNFIYRHRKDDREFMIDTVGMRRELGSIRLDTKEVLDYVSYFISENLDALAVCT